MPSTNSNPFLLAADNSPKLIILLHSDPAIASAQDDHGYSLVHAAASYNHLDLLRTLVHELKVPVDLRDEDGETALFVCETVECARTLVEELQADVKVKNEEGKIAREKIQAEGDFLEVAAYLLELEDENKLPNTDAANGAAPQANIINCALPLPEGVSIDIGTMQEEDIDEDAIDSDFKQRIEELAVRGDFHGEEGQKELRELITEAVRGHVGQERDIRRRTR